MSDPLAIHDYVPGELPTTLEFLKRTRWELRSLRKVHVWPNRLQIFDINGDSFEIRGIGYGDGDIIAMLRAVNAAFEPTMIHEPTNLEYKEFKTGRRHPWAEDRVM